MNIVVCSDAHLDHTTAGVSRFAEIERGMLEAAAHASRIAADAFVFAGDLCDPDSGPVVLRCARVAVHIAHALERADIPSLWLAGNHDVAHDGNGTTSLSPLHAIAEVYDVPGIATGRHDWSHDLLMLPHVSGAIDYSARVRELAAIATKPLVIFSHLTIPGIDPGEESTEMPRGAERTLPIEAIEALPQVACVISGHYHERASYFLKGGRACVGNPGAQIELHVVGSLARLTFGEERHRPGYIVVEV